MTFEHKSVLLKETVDSLNVKPEGIYVDGTLGGGGHAFEVCRHLGTKGRLIGIDQDEDAIRAAALRLKVYEDKVRIIKSNYENIRSVLKGLHITGVDGICLDLGVSSYQLDTPERGFTYREDAPLDMRMDRSQYLTAFNIVNEFGASEIIKILFDYGEEKLAKRITENIVKFRSRQTIETTLQLAKIVEDSYPAATRFKYGHPAKRTFQAIRIAVNDELGTLKESLKQMAMRLNGGGRMAVITFHSLEDRIVKTAFKELSTDCTCPPDFPICVCGNKKEAELVNRKPILPSEDELKNNSRSQSAKLRIIQRL